MLRSYFKIVIDMNAQSSVASETRRGQDDIG